MGNIKTSASLDEVIDAAYMGNWAFVDEQLPELVKDQRVKEWAVVGGLVSPKGDLRDLAASIIEKANPGEPLGSQVFERLTHMILNDPAKYVRFRAACALSNHGYRSGAQPCLENYLEDEDPEVARIAKSYIEFVGHRHTR